MDRLPVPAGQLPGARPDYRADVDGLRALAVVAVLVFHAHWSAFSGGFVGVDVFFVISGFVISLSLFRDLDAGRFSLGGFFARRAKRILPALTAVLLATLAASLLIVPPVYFGAFADSLIAASLFVSNVHFWHATSYFNDDSPFRPLLHTWSLGVEEQFYLAAPVMLLAIRRFLGSRWRLVVTACLLGSFALNLYAVRHGHIDAAFFLPFTRAWEFLLGVLIALVPRAGLPRGVREVLAVLGLTLIVVPVFIYGPATVFPGLAALWPCLGAGLVIWCGVPSAAGQQTLVARALSLPPVVWTGRISYSLYLVHWPVMVLAPFILARRLNFGETLLALAACFLLAWLVYRFIETPLRRVRLRNSMVLMAAAACALGTAAAGWAGERVNARYFAGQPAYERVPDFNGSEQAWKVGSCLLVDGQAATDWSADVCRIGEGDGPVTLLLGDSFAAHYVPGLKAGGIVPDGPIFEYAMQGCPPLLAPGSQGLPACEAFRERVPELIRRLGVQRVVVSGSWLEYGPGTVPGVAHTLSVLKAADVEVTLVGQSPNFYLPPYMIIARRADKGAPDASLPLSPAARRMNQRLADIAARAGADFIDPTESLCKGGQCAVRLNGEDLFLDYGHLTPAGSARAVRAYFPGLKREAAPAVP